MYSLDLKIKTLADQVDYLQNHNIYLYYREMDSAQDAEMMADGRKILMFGSNSYLGLTNHPKVKEAAIQAIREYGTGVSGSRLLNGNLRIHRELEERLAAFVGKEDAVVVSTGFQANLAAIPPIIDRSGYLIMDKLSHASILESAALSFGRKSKFEHDDLNSLEDKLSICPADATKMVVTEGVFSMDGDIPDLPGLTALANRYGALVMVDDAHALGVLGQNGSGSSSHFQVTDRVDLITGTFSKSLAALGGFVASSFEIIKLIKHTSRSQMFSAGLQPASVAAVMAALEVIAEEPERIEQLWKNTRYAMELMKQTGFDNGTAETPIIPVYVRDDDKTYLLARRLYDDGIFVNPVVSPATSPDQALIRFSIMATHTRSQIEEAIDKMHFHAKALEIL
ncbi:MAG TPA: pyridoxal phosphate-dependent aminotransferase family protein [Saprospiraceae bacterium]|nr:pyridoxal phosphate-dependent aminotransferase family protein [Saprospiraceae bacterium]HNT21709.1 pyridoxal phosphate-dependent aminotransferase family protein [Saprospiraceae bacterium]